MNKPIPDATFSKNPRWRRLRRRLRMRTGQFIAWLDAARAGAPAPGGALPRDMAGRRMLFAGCAMLGAIVAVGAGYSLWRGFAPIEQTDNAYVRGDISFVSARVPGHILEILAENNREVARGQVLAKIDPRDFDAALMAAEADLAQRRAALSEHEARIELQHAEIARASAAIVAAQAGAERASREFERIDALLARGFATRQRFDEARAGKIEAQAGVLQAQAQLRQARQQVTVMGEERQSAMAALQGAEARLYEARLDRDAAEIRAPIDGVVAARQADIGEYVTVGTRLLAVVPRTGLYVEANFRETQIARIRPGDRVRLGVDALPGLKLCGTVESLSGASGSDFAVIPPDTASGNFTKIVRRFPVRIRLNGGQPGLEHLRSGMSATPAIAIGSHQRSGGAC